MLISDQLSSTQMGGCASMCCVGDDGVCTMIEGSAADYPQTPPWGGFSKKTSWFPCVTTKCARMRTSVTYGSPLTRGQRAHTHNAPARGNKHTTYASSHIRAHTHMCRAHPPGSLEVSDCSAHHAPTVLAQESQSDEPSGFRTAPARCSCKILPKATPLVRD